MAAYSGQIAVETAGTAVQGPDIANDQGMFYLHAHPANTGLVWYGGDGEGDVTNANGFPLVAAGGPVIATVTNLNQLWFDANVSGEKICWVKA